MRTYRMDKLGSLDGLVAHEEPNRPAQPRWSPDGNTRRGFGVLWGYAEAGADARTNGPYPRGRLAIASDRGSRTIRS
jgi:hypothetical protein